jgi:hypothetical protein
MCSRDLIIKKKRWFVHQTYIFTSTDHNKKGARRSTLPSAGRERLVVTAIFWLNEATSVAIRKPSLLHSKSVVIILRLTFSQKNLHICLKWDADVQYLGFEQHAPSRLSGLLGWPSVIDPRNFSSSAQQNRKMRRSKKVSQYRTHSKFLTRTWCISSIWNKVQVQIEVVSIGWYPWNRQVQTDWDCWERKRCNAFGQRTHTRCHLFSPPDPCSASRRSPLLWVVIVSSVFRREGKIVLCKEMRRD